MGPAHHPSDGPVARGGARAPVTLLVGAAAALLAGTLARPAPAAAQARLSAPSGSTLVLEGERVREMLRQTRRLRQILEQDPRVLYYVGYGEEVSGSDSAAAYPWNAVTVTNDSVARIATPGNFREADRAYAAYAVKKMESLRGDPPAVECRTAVEREVEQVSAFVDGWIVARALFGGPAFSPLDALAFAREAERLPGLLVHLGDVSLGPCLKRWERDHPDRLEAARRWYRAAYLGLEPEG